jgi:invasion protein IalB
MRRGIFSGPAGRNRFGYWFFRGILPIAMLTAFGAVPAFAAEGSGLPGGATSLRETYQDWAVACAIQDKVKYCSFSQQQNQKNGPRVLAIELAPAKEGGLSGTLVLPFGLMLADGVRYQIDDGKLADALPFRTCLPAGCLVPLAFDAATAKALRAGTTMKLTVVRSDNNEPFALSVSLDGFAPAMDRTSALVK